MKPFYILIITFIMMGISGCITWNGTSAGPSPQNTTDCNSKYKEKQELIVDEVKLEYYFEDKYVEYGDINSLSIHGISWKSGHLGFFSQILPEESEVLRVSKSEIDWPYIQVRAGASDCGKIIEKTYTLESRDSVDGNRFADFPVIPKKKINYLQFIAKTVRTNGFYRIRVVWDFGLESIKADRIKINKHGYIDNSGTKVSVKAKGLATVTDNYTLTDNNNNNSNNHHNDNGRGRTGGSGNDLYHDIDFEPVVPVDPFDPTSTLFGDSIAQLEESETRVFVREASVDAVKLIDNSSCYTDTRLIEAIRRGDVMALKTLESAPVPSFMERPVYSNGSFKSSLKWEKPMVYKIVKTKKD